MDCEVKEEWKPLKDGKGLESEINRRKLVGHWQPISTFGS